MKITWFFYGKFLLSAYWKIKFKAFWDCGVEWNIKEFLGEIPKK
jgi:hypothetical protein